MTDGLVESLSRDRPTYILGRTAESLHGRQEPFDKSLVLSWVKNVNCVRGPRGDAARYPTLQRLEVEGLAISRLQLVTVSDELLELGSAA